MVLPAFAYTNGTSPQSNNESQSPWIQYVNSFVSGSALVTALTFWVKYRHDQQTAIQSNFMKILELIGEEETRKQRALLIRYEIQLKKLFRDRNLDPELYDVLIGEKKDKSLLTQWEMEIVNAYDKVALSYDRLAFLLFQDKKLLKKIIDYHGSAVLRQWGIIGNFLTTLQNQPTRKDYCKYFNQLVKEIEKKLKITT